MLIDHWDKSTLHFVRPHFEKARHLVQISTGFFTVQGFDLVREVLTGKQVQLLIGFDEQSREQLREKLIEDIMFQLSCWDAADRRASVIDMVERIRQGRLVLAERQDRTERFDARSRNKDHAKVFIMDELVAIVGSTNLTVSGLLHNSESCAMLDDPERVRFYADQFEKRWNDKDTCDLTETLLEALLAWLRLYDPFDIYLKALQTLKMEKTVSVPRKTYTVPVEYQQVVIARVLRQLYEYRGAMLVASTGLGKTVMATDVALRLSNDWQIMNCLVFAPKQIHPDWRQAMNSAGLNVEIFTRELLDRGKDLKGHKSNELESALNSIDSNYLIIIDESQYFRNLFRASDGKKRHSFKRLMVQIQKREPLVLLLTATPFSKDIGDLNNQLLLLPHTAEKKYVTRKGQYIFPGFMDDAIAPEAWSVQEGEDYFERFLDLPVSTVISTSQVAKDFAQKTAEGEFLDFGNEKRWIPKIGITKVSVPLLLEDQMALVLSNKIFEHELVNFKSRDKWQRTTKTIQKEAEIAWCSSPRALADVIRHTIAENGYDVNFTTPIDIRREQLTPLLDTLDRFSFDDDPKLVQLISFLKKYREEGRKVIIFTERLHTALYLADALKERIPALAVANSVMEKPDGPALRQFDPHVLTMIKWFAPEANKDKILPGEKPTHYDVFISTDAYSTGVNLQDASVVINYDLAWTPDIIIQRAGRILRFWKEPRKVDFIVFTGIFRDKLLNKQAKLVESRLNKLTVRSRQAEKFSELPLLPESDSASFDSMSALSSIKIEYLGLAETDQIEEFSGVSPFLRHITTLQKHKTRAESLPDDISSAMVYPGDKLLIFLLLKVYDRPETVLFDVRADRLVSKKEDELLNMISCKENTPLADVDPDYLEQLAQRARKYWVNKTYPTDDFEVSRICVLYLIPEKMKAGPGIILAGGREQG